MKFLQIWVLARKNGIKPRYQQVTIADQAKPNDFQQILSPNADDDGVWIHQDAWFSLANFDKDTSRYYQIKKSGNGVYVFVIKGSANIGDRQLGERDGLGIWDVDGFELTATSDAQILLMDVPMDIAPNTNQP